MARSLCYHQKVRENDYVIDIDGEIKMFHANMLRKYDTRKPEGMLFLCGSRHLEIVVGGVPECDPVSSDNHEDLGESTREDITYCPLNWTC